MNLCGLYCVQWSVVFNRSHSQTHCCSGVHWKTASIQLRLSWCWIWTTGWHCVFFTENIVWKYFLIFWSECFWKPCSFSSLQKYLSSVTVVFLWSSNACYHNCTWDHLGRIFKKFLCSYYIFNKIQHFRHSSANRRLIRAHCCLAVFI